MAYNPITEIRLVEMREHVPLGNNIYEDKFAGYKVQFRCLGKYKETDWITAPTITEYINDRKDNSLTSNIQRSVRKEDSSIS